MAFGLVLAALLVLYNTLINLLPFPPRLYVPANLLLLAVVLAAGRGRGFSWNEMGFSRASLGPGLRWGGAIAFAAAACLAIALVLPAAGRFLADRRLAGIGGGELLYRVLVRIPLGTALLEEAAFRGVLYAAWSREASPTAAVAGSSLAFGLWHVGPALELLRINDIASAPLARALAVTGSVVATAAGGALFALLRLRTGGIVGPVLAHAVINALSTLAAFAHQRSV